MKITFISDPHGQHEKLSRSLIGGDIIVCAGDITTRGSEYSVKQFLEWFDSLDYTHKIFIAGNHDFYFEENTKEVINELLSNYNVVYLDKESVTIEGIKFYGIPDTPEFYNWAFNRTESEMKDITDNIPNDTDILITHGPPHSILDRTYSNENVGCKHLYNKVLEVNPKICIFGHIHEGYGMRRIHECDTVYINASVLNHKYRPVNRPVNINYKIKE